MMFKTKNGNYLNTGYIIAINPFLYPDHKMYEVVLIGEIKEYVSESDFEKLKKILCFK